MRQSILFLLFTTALAFTSMEGLEPGSFDVTQHFARAASSKNCVANRRKPSKGGAVKLVRRTPTTPTTDPEYSVELVPRGGYMCEATGSLKNPDNGPSQRGLTFQKCADYCKCALGDDCVSFSYTKGSGLCKTYGDNLRNMGYRTKGGNSNTVYYSQFCFDTEDPTTTKTHQTQKHAPTAKPKRRDVAADAMADALLGL